MNYSDGKLSFFSCISLKICYTYICRQILFFKLKGGISNGYSFGKECSKKRKRIFVLCGWQGKSLPCKNGSWWKEEEEKKEIISGYAIKANWIGLVS